MAEPSVVIIGAGLAGCECALQLASCGINVTLFEQKPCYRSPAHSSSDFAELVCSNSFRSAECTSAIGLLKEEMRLLGSFFMQVADQCRVPADKALAVDRVLFSRKLTELVRKNLRIRVIHRRIDDLEDVELGHMSGQAVIIAAGPLASSALLESLGRRIGHSHCYFYDAIAPIVWTDSLDSRIIFRSSRYLCETESPENQGDYLNCPMNREEYELFYSALCAATLAPVHPDEEEKHFEACMPIEALARRGPKTLVFGPLKPVGFVDPRTGRRPWALLQLRAENINGATCNLVGCQTKMLQSEQERVFRLVPGMENAEFARFGSMHRNTFVNAPRVLTNSLELKNSPGFYIIGQLSGVEGYVESAASGLWLGRWLGIRLKQGTILPDPPPDTALGALLRHLRTETKNFQPSNVNWGLMPQLDEVARKKERKLIYARRAVASFARWLERNEAILRRG